MVTSAEVARSLYMSTLDKSSSTTHPLLRLGLLLFMKVGDDGASDGWLAERLLVMYRVCDPLLSKVLWAAL